MEHRNARTDMAKSRKRTRKKQPVPPGSSQSLWWEDDGVHAMIPDEGQPLDLDALNRDYQAKIRQSPLWDTMVAEYGQEKAEALLKEFKVELRT